MRNTLLCTVGTSFLGNLKRLEPGSDMPAEWEEIRLSSEQKDWKRVARLMANIDPAHGCCGAEINTIEHLRYKKGIDLDNLIFLVSDTEQGRNMGQFLKKYFALRKDLKFKTLDYAVIENLQDEAPRDFRTKGLRNLVKTIGDYIQRFGGERFVALDATGGYKAQIAIAVVIGQALNIPVYYKHERFNEIIDFPPLPISLDYDLVGENADILMSLEQGSCFAESELGVIDERLKIFLTEVEVDGERLYELSPIGQVYLLSYDRRHQSAPQTLEKAVERKEPTFGNDHHYPGGLKKFVNKIWEENKWIKTIHTEPYYGQRDIKGKHFRVKSDKDGYKLIGTYKHKDFGARFRIRISDESKNALNWAAVYLGKKYGGQKDI
ncbi:putative CRISPR-associated protein [Desulfohalobiaceae bacterium Ax17]|uniref:putative CRISPR-associated protein n=1 Tax=Desulfovulcanus ferrireducens TaxID=2831190 RepID=UPI00207BB1EA|nr:putative CRISPR-associated protein [Desulfovulcanus ferrireducens]MBT8763257.1 putative CRISPR-associated protein [Desulfovulcanus ferrireducens]